MLARIGGEQGAGPGTAQADNCPSAELPFELISRAYERSSVVVTSNLPFEQWTEVLLSERLAGATLARLTHRGTILETGGESYRLRAARRHRRGEGVNTAPGGK